MSEQVIKPATKAIWIIVSVLKYSFDVSLIVFIDFEIGCVYTKATFFLRNNKFTVIIIFKEFMSSFAVRLVPCALSKGTREGCFSILPLALKKHVRKKSKESSSNIVILNASCQCRSKYKAHRNAIVMLSAVEADPKSSSLALRLRSW